MPHGYWHMVVNLDECIAITHNYVSTSNLSNVLRFLRDKTDQISGVRDRGDEAIQPEAVYPAFLQQLLTVLPPDVLEKHVQESMQPDVRDASDNTSKSRLLLQRSKTAMRKKCTHKNKMYGEIESGTAGGDDNNCSSKSKCKTNSNVDDESSKYTGDHEQKKSEENVEVKSKSMFSFGFDID